MRVSVQISFCAIDFWVKGKETDQVLLGNSGESAGCLTVDSSVGAEDAPVPVGSSAWTRKWLVCPPPIPGGDTAELTNSLCAVRMPLSKFS